MATFDKLNDLRIRKEKLKQGGGSSRIEMQHEKGKKTARERISMLLIREFC